ncbi:MAG: hypothetical protein JRH11_22685, partial [Deltaproteobacteria bacterium]|nr:hypothetical protein [Deltaproteobacteria bacterium]
AIDSPSEDAAAAEDGTVRSHHFAGGDTARPSGQGNEEHLRIVQEQLRRAVEIDIVSALSSNGERTLPADGAPIRAGDGITLDVVIRNESAGHRFPGGVRDTQDTWIELRVVGANGATIAEAGTQRERGDDPTAFVLRTLVLDEHGQPELEHLVHRFRAVAYDHSVPVRGARVVRYSFDVPERLPSRVLPLRVEARLRHRRHSRAFQAFVCEANRTPRGRAFARASRQRGHAPIDPCRAQPITDLATSVVWLGGERPGEGGAERPTWRRLFDYSLGLLGDVQDHLDYARPSIARGLEAAGDQDVRRRAMFMALRARLEAKQGRLAEALDWARRAEELVGEHPAIWRIRGRAYAQVWQWESASTALERVTQLAPGDTAGWRDLAQARGSAGHDREALSAAQAGLALLPRDESLLRSQALALEHLGSPSAGAAQESWLNFRQPDDHAALRIRCGQDVPGCERERQPVPVYRMRQPASR